MAEKAGVCVRMIPRRKRYKEYGTEVNSKSYKQSLLARLNFNTQNGSRRLQPAKLWQYAILEPESRQYFLTNDQKQGLKLARKKCPEKVFYVFAVEQLEKLLNDYRHYRNRVPIVKRREVIEENNDYNELVGNPINDSVQIPYYGNQVFRLRRIGDHQNVANSKNPPTVKSLLVASAIASGRILRRYSNRVLFACVMLGALAFAPKALGDEIFEGQVLPNQGTLPDSVFFYDVNESLIDRTYIQPTGYYIRSPSGTSSGDTITIKFKNNLNAPTLAEIYLPDIRGPPPVRNYPPTIHARQNAGEPLVNFTAYRTILLGPGGSYPIYVACLTKNNPTVLLDTLTENPTNYQHALHLFSQLNPDSVKFLFYHDDGVNIDNYYADSIPRFGGWLKDSTNFGDVMSLKKKGISDPGGISNTPYDTIDLRFNLSIPKPNDAAADSVRAQAQVQQGLPINVQGYVENKRWFNMLINNLIRLINASGDTVAYASKTDTLGPSESAIETFTIGTASIPLGDYRIFLRAVANNDQDASNDTASTLVKIIQGTFGWQQLTDAPLGGGKKFKAGTDACTDAYNRIWVIKGGTLENWIYNPSNGLWTQAANLPAGTKGKAKKGSSLGYADGKVYYKEGYGPGFWSKDTSANAQWIPLQNYTVDGKAIKGGTSLAGDLGNLIFMTVGSRNRNKMAIVAKYSILGNNWAEELLSEALVPKKKFKDGASIVYTPFGMHAAVGQTSGILKRDASGNWTKVTDITPVTRKMRGDITYNASDGFLYTAEGGNVPTFNRCQIPGYAWQALQSWPIGREGKNPKDCAIVYSNGEIFALKVKNTRGFWKYIPPALVNSASKNLEGNVQEQEVSVRNESRIPTIMKARELSKYTNNFDIYDISGKKIDSNHLSSGVFFLIPKYNGKQYKVIIPQS